ncbi:TIGR02710 family CRISPR-associated CARF protein [uncultured Desulfobacter sp.]|uniref:TIGR02710 family CRISPR-associated CARF protein n=1 Tax=uncultured Desulfobacter sp. TaxID=240139 RepID=UPI002AAB0086|nr:TIGR02710 family CRISPR-associated CARF protein [uncultured Desulfobacter sp.]
MSETFLIATVGGSPAPIVASIKKWQPVRVLFIVSMETKKSVTTDTEFNGRPSPCILTSIKENGIADFTGRYDFFEIPDPQDYTALVREFRRIDQTVNKWKRDYDDIRIVVDITGGTKPMSAAMALIASRWENSTVSYVGGTERTKDGVGVVVDGKEQISHAHNPWAALGYLVEEQVKTLFNHGAYAAAKRLLEPARNAADSPRKEELNAFITLCDFFYLWNNFQHKAALKMVPRIEKDWNNLPIDADARSGLQHRFSIYKTELTQLTKGDNTEATGNALVRDLLANARRCMGQEEFDDAVARLYRAAEALAQARLCRYDFPDTGAIAFNRLPKRVQEMWQSHTRDQKGCIKLGLQDDFTLLYELDDERGRCFRELHLHDPQKSMLSARNKSILAHGYEPVSRIVAEKLLNATLKLADIEKENLLQFPKI